MSHLQAATPDTNGEASSGRGGRDGSTTTRQGNSTGAGGRDQRAVIPLPTDHDALGRDIERHFRGLRDGAEIKTRFKAWPAWFRVACAAVETVGDHARKRAAVEAALGNVAPDEAGPIRAALAKAAGLADDDLRDKAPVADAPNEADNDPHRLARVILAARFSHRDGATLRHHQGEFWHFDGAAYRPLPAGELRPLLTAGIKAEADRLNVEAQRQSAGSKVKPTALRVTSGLVGNVELALSSYTYLGRDIRPPAWLDGPGPHAADEILVARNGLVHLPSLATGPPVVLKPTPRFFATASIGCGFDAEASKPTEWLKFLGDLWPGDPDSIRTLQEWCGYLLTPDTRHQKICMLIGPKRSGKGTIARVVTAMLGAENVANPTLASLGVNFGLAPLIGKSAAIVADARLSGRTDLAQVVERLLSISGEDSQTVDRKHQAAYNGRLSARFMLISNELPRLNDSSGALAGRMILLALTRSFYGEEDHGLTDRLLSELPGILLWAVEGWKSLRERGRFVQPEAGRPLAEELAELASPVGTFVADCCRVGPDCRVPVKDLFARWRQWCAEKNRENVGDEQAFGRNLRAAVPGLKTPQARQGEGRIRVFVGVEPAGPEF